MPLYKSFGLICLFDMPSAGEPCACSCRNVTAAVLRRWDVSGAGMNQNRSNLIGWTKKVGSSCWHGGDNTALGWLGSSSWVFLGNGLQQAALKVFWTVYIKHWSNPHMQQARNCVLAIVQIIWPGWAKLPCESRWWDVIVFQRTSYTEHVAICDTKYAYIPRSVWIWTSHIISRFSNALYIAEVWTIYRGFALAPCDVSLAMLSLDHRLVRLTIDMLLHSYMHKWKHSWFRLQVRV